MVLFLYPKGHGQNINLMLETWILESIKVNHKLEKGLGHEVEVAAHHTGQHETFLSCGR